MVPFVALGLTSLFAFLINIFAVSMVVLFMDEIKVFLLDFMNWALTHVSTVIDIEPVTITFTGFAAYMIDVLRIGDGLTVVLSCILIRFTLSLIPFL